MSESEQADFDSCGHCGIRRVYFEQYGSYEPEKTRDGWYYTYDLGVCAGCNHASLLVYRSRKPEDEEAQPYAIYPSSDVAPQHVPNRARKLYNEATETQGISLEGAGMLFRKTLEASLHTDKDMKLIARIKRAAKNQKITPAMEEWAHHIRVVGNAAAHEIEDFTPEEIAELQEFTRLFLMYLFTLPRMMKDAKARRSSPSGK